MLPEVWSAFAADPDAPVEVLLSPFKDASAGRVAGYLEDALNEGDAGAHSHDRHAIAYLEGIVAARLTFNELIGTVLPLSEWWKRAIKQLGEGMQVEGGGERFLRQVLGLVLQDTESTPGTGRPDVPGDVARVMTLIALIEVARLRRHTERDLRREQARNAKGGGKKQVTGRYARALSARFSSIEEALNHASSRKTVMTDACRALGNVVERWRNMKAGEAGLPNLVWLVSLNRPVYPALKQSVPAIKADAALKLFNVDCSKISWAIVDSGIDELHPAFIDEKGRSRVERVYDFSMLRPILKGAQSALGSKKILAQQIAERSGEKTKDIEQRLKVIEADRQSGRAVDWKQLGPLLRRVDGAPPYSEHGTHVAGILGANWKNRNGGDGQGGKAMVGVCPDIRLYDLRVLCETVEETEFAVIGALQFIRYLNDRSGYMTIHGANLSLSIPHDVRNFACGRTPVCDEANRLAANGVVVVAAAGNLGYQSFQVRDGVFEGYSTVSITDPGNADDVITVGATHRYRPLTYGVSFFSSRGPDRRRAH